MPCRRIGAPKGITATARKLGIIIYTPATTRKPYDESIFAEHQQKSRQKRLNFLIKEASALETSGERIALTMLVYFTSNVTFAMYFFPSPFDWKLIQFGASGIRLSVFSM